MKLKSNTLTKLIAVIMICLFSSVVVVAQTTIRGKVVDADNGEGLPGATVQEVGTQNGVITDIDGSYMLTVSGPESEIEISFVGFASQRFVVGARTVFDVQLSSDTDVLEEVVVIGYGTAKEKELTGSVALVKSEDIAKLNPTRIEQALQGQSAGVQISSQSGSPGSGFNIRIRGISTNGDNNPLILVDGVRYDDLSALNPSSIESINVLKDATAGIYGVQAANGVILITTKQGTKDMKPQISINSYFGVQETSRKIPVLNAQEYGVLINEAHANAGFTLPFSDISGFGEGTDWQDLVFEVAPIQDHNLNIRGGGSNSTYAVGLGYFDQQGIVGGDKAAYERLAINLNTTFNITDQIKIENVINYNNSYRTTLLENTIGSVLFNAINIAPTFAPRDSDGNYTRPNGLGNEIINPLAQIENTFNENFSNRVNGKTGVTYEIMDNLSISTSLNYNYTSNRFKSFFPEFDYGDNKVFNQPQSIVNENQQLFWSLDWVNLIRYEREFLTDHKAKLTLGSSAFKNRGESIFTTGRGVPNNAWEFADVSLANERLANEFNTGQYDAPRLLSYFGRLEYSYQYKYLFSFILRRDGSNRFGPKNRIGWFPSASVGWVMTDEAFFPDLPVEFAKLRASYGITGNDKIPDFQYISQNSGEGVYVFDNALVNGVALGPITNPEIKWEENTQLDVGLDLEMLNNRLSVTLDYFNKKTIDLLVGGIPVSGLLGGAAPGSSLPTANAASVRNSGLELALNYEGQLKNGLNYSFGYNVSKVKNETLAINNNEGRLEAGFHLIGGGTTTLWTPGQPLGVFYGKKVAGVFQNAEEVAGSAQPTAQVGDLRYVDQDGDGDIDDDDRVILGSPIPEYIMGFTAAADFKGFDFSALVNASFGNLIQRNFERIQTLANKPRIYLQRWVGEGTSNFFPIVSETPGDNVDFSDFWLENGSYARIRNVQIGYSLPEKYLRRINATKFRIYASVNNLYTFTKYTGFDPNVSSGNPLANGIDLGFYPQPRTYIIGLNLSF